ncbi:MAG: PEP-CTERM sorting domain-containing protein, partial [Planctomycetaceae bacterium]
VLVDHQPSNFGGPASDTLFAEFPNWQRVADDFLLPSDAVLHRIVWWGFHNMNVQPVANEDFRIRVYDQRPSDLLPGSVLYEQSFTSVPRTWTGQFVLVSGAPQEFRYEVDLPFPLSLPTTSSLWLEIVQVGDETTRFRWENSNFSLPQNGKAFINSLTANMDWENTFPTGTTNAAFQLIGQVPEPGSITLLAVTGVAVIRRRSRRWS